MKSSPSRRVIVAGDADLCRKSHFQRLAIATRALEYTRREIPNVMADVIFGFDGKILRPDGRSFAIADDAIDLAFNDDGSFRWLSDFLRFAVEPPKQRPQERLIERLRLIDLAFRIACPERAKWIAA
ncbi:MAG: hypothetical protein AAF732_19380 [Pseudomonadota bacterium]